MIKPVTYYTVICDECKKDAFEGSEIAAWNTDYGAEESALADDWEEVNGKHYCWDCYVKRNFPDNDE